MKERAVYVFSQRACQNFFCGEESERDRVFPAPVGIPVIQISFTPEFFGQSFDFAAVHGPGEISPDEALVELQGCFPGFFPLARPGGCSRTLPRYGP